ncbi:cytochrome P450 [Stachybotrys elegans]|uniref:Cytochrome P450 n=1 Tax=Stachybotrys elegans TaxID=80388 RepID=A0A8K0SSC1_9HYPO|nr:cytochrome P450 [Stachybotrys elegans]
MRLGKGHGTTKLGNSLARSPLGVLHCWLQCMGGGRWTSIRKCRSHTHPPTYVICMRVVEVGQLVPRSERRVSGQAYPVVASSACKPCIQRALMELSTLTSAIWALPEEHGVVLSSLIILLVSSGALALLYSQKDASPGPRPKALRDPIPGIFNTVQFASNNDKFMKRIKNVIEAGHSIVRFSLGPKTVYLVVGAQNIRTFFSRDLVHDITNQEQMTRFALPTLYKMKADEVRRWEEDNSGVTKTPIRGTEHIPARQRLWYNYEHIYAEYLGKQQYVRPLVAMFTRNLGQVLQSYPTDQWTTISIQDICRGQIAQAAISALFGPNMVGLSPDFVDRFWDFDKHVFRLVMGLPRWMNPAPSKAHDRYTDCIEKWLADASDGFDWDGDEAEADWEPRFGGRAVRELYKWMKETDWRNETIAATLGALVFALNSNSIPTTAWMLMEILADASLLQAVREEVATAVTTDAETGKLKVDSQKLVELPLLQSIWTETLRLRINFNIGRDVKQPVTLSGYTIPKGSLLQAPMSIAHYDESIWGTAGHPASEFWAERHIKYSDQACSKRSYAMAGRPTCYFPFGGGANMCPGRQLAKFEVLTSVALVVSCFDIEVQGWTKMDGSPSDRPAESDLRYSGAGAMPPDRDLKMQWRRIVEF